MYKQIAGSPLVKCAAAFVVAIALVQIAGAGERVVSLEAKQGPVGDAVHAALLNAASPSFSGAIVLELNGVTILKSGYGFANREAHIPFTSTTIAQIGSISKSFTAAAIAHLEAQGKLKTNRPVSTYLPELVGKQAGAVTLQQLLTHSGGYPEYCGDDFDRIEATEMLKTCIAPLQIKDPKHSYSNAGYSVLGLIVERVSGQGLEPFLAQYISDPLDMHDTGYLFPTTQRDRFAVGYLKGENQGIISDRIAKLDGAYWALKGNGGIQSTLPDMATWGHAVFGLDARFPALAQRLADKQTWGRTEDPKVYYSYGMNIALRADGSVQRFSHTGSDGVFWSLLRWYPQEKLFVYFVGNSGEEDVKQAVLPAIAVLKKAANVSD